MKITILGQTPAQKNDKEMAVNRRTGKPFPVTSKAVKEWQKSAALQLAQYRNTEPDKKLTAAYMFYVKDKRRRDTDNMICTVNDALVKAGLIKDDSCWQLAIGGADAELDRDNPRAEIWLDE